MTKSPFNFRAPLPTGALCVLLACTLPVAAQVSNPAPAAPAVTATGPAMTIPQVIERLAATGYNDIKEVERKSDKLYEVTARDAKGVWMELHVDARSGEILRSKLDD